MLFEVGKLKFYFYVWNTAFVHAFLFLGGIELDSFDRLLSSWLSKLFRLHFHGLFLHISSFQEPQLELNRHEIDPNLLLALRRRSVCRSVTLSLFLVCSFAATNHRNQLVSPFSREFLLFFSLICKNLRYTNKPQALFFGYGFFTLEGHQDSGIITVAKLIGHVGETQQFTDSTPGGKV